MEPINAHVPQAISLAGLSILHQCRIQSTLDDDREYVAVLQLMVEPHSLVIEFRTRPSYAGKSELSDEVAVQFDADVLNRGIVLDDERLVHVGLLALRLEKDPHEAQIFVDEIL